MKGKLEERKRYGIRLIERQSESAAQASLVDFWKGLTGAKALLGVLVTSVSGR